MADFNRSDNYTGPCSQNCPNRRWNCHMKGECKAHDDWVEVRREAFKKSESVRSATAIINAYKKSKVAKAQHRAHYSRASWGKHHDN